MRVASPLPLLKLPRVIDVFRRSRRDSRTSSLRVVRRGLRAARLQVESTEQRHSPEQPERSGGGRFDAALLAWCPQAKKLELQGSWAAVSCQFERRPGALTIPMPFHAPVFIWELPCGPGAPMTSSSGSEGAVLQSSSAPG